MGFVGFTVGFTEKLGLVRCGLGRRVEGLRLESSATPNVSSVYSLCLILLTLNPKLECFS